MLNPTWFVDAVRVLVWSVIFTVVWPILVFVVFERNWDGQSSGTAAVQFLASPFGMLAYSMTGSSPVAWMAHVSSSFGLALLLVSGLRILRRTRNEDRAKSEARLSRDKRE